MDISNKLEDLQKLLNELRSKQEELNTHLKDQVLLSLNKFINDGFHAEVEFNKFKSMHDLSLKNLLYIKSLEDNISSISSYNKYGSYFHELREIINIVMKPNIESDYIKFIKTNKFYAIEIIPQRNYSFRIKIDRNIDKMDIDINIHRKFLSDQIYNTDTISIVDSELKCLNHDLYFKGGKIMNDFIFQKEEEIISFMNNIILLMYMLLAKDGKEVNDIIKTAFPSDIQTYEVYDAQPNIRSYMIDDYIKTMKYLLINFMKNLKENDKRGIK